MADRPKRETIGLLIETDGPGGAEVMFLELAEELRRRGHQVVPVGPANGVGWLSGRLRERGFQPGTFTLRRALDWGCALGLRDLLAHRKVDVVHGHEFTMAVYGAAAARMLHKPYVITMHGGQTVTKALRRRIALRWAFRRSRGTVAVSDQMGRFMESELGLRRGFIRTVRNGITPRLGVGDRVRAELGLQPGEVLLVAVGNLYPIKGHRVLLDALKRMEENGVRGWRAAIAGRGQELEPLQQLARSHGITDRLHLLGYREDVPDLLAAADIFVMPSIWEGLPLALLEAMFSGKAIVATAVSGIPEAIASGEHGLLVPPSDPAALADALARLARDPELRRRLGAAARARAVAEFTVERMADEYERLYAGA
jgi:glycosyltransferase involved in cell wall biosynthesis